MIDTERVINCAKTLVSQGKAKNLSEIARKCGLGHQYFTDLKRGKSRPSLKFIDTLCDTYNINKVYILTGDGEMFNSQQLAKDNHNVVSNRGNITGSTITQTAGEVDLSSLLRQLVETNAQLVETNAQLVSILNETKKDSREE